MCVQCYVFTGSERGVQWDEKSKNKLRAVPVALCCPLFLLILKINIVCLDLSLSKNVSVITYNRSGIKSILYDVCCFSAKHSDENILPLLVSHQGSLSWIISVISTKIY